MSTLRLTTPLFDVLLLVDDDTGCIQRATGDLRPMIGWNAELAVSTLRRGFDASDLGPAVSVDVLQQPRPTLGPLHNLFGGTP